MPCPNPACPLSWTTETDPATGIVRPYGSDEPGGRRAKAWCRGLGRATSGGC
jgi:hypothetical protein